MILLITRHYTGCRNYVVLYITLLWPDWYKYSVRDTTISVDAHAQRAVRWTAGREIWPHNALHEWWNPSLLVKDLKFKRDYFLLEQNQISFPHSLKSLGTGVCEFQYNELFGCYFLILLKKPSYTCVLFHAGPVQIRCWSSRCSSVF